MINTLISKIRILWLRFKIRFLGYQISFDEPDPIELRDAAIEQYKKRLEYEIIDNVNVLRYEDEHFYNYLDFLKRYSLNSGMILTDNPDTEKWNVLNNVLREQARKQAEFFWTLNHIVPVQLIHIPDNAQEKEDNKEKDHLTYYSLEYKDSNEGNSDDLSKKMFTLEIIKNTTKSKKETLPFMPLFQYFDIPAVGNMANLGVKIANEHYVGDVLTVMVDQCDKVEHIKNDNKILPNILKTSHAIAMDTMRGAGNYIIIDTVDIPWLSTSLQNSAKTSISEEDHFNGIHEDSILKYEFTLNSHIRVFSSDIFGKIAEGKGMNMLIGYSGARSSTDSGTFLIPSEYFKWKDIPFQSNELRDTFIMKYGSEPMSSNELDEFAKKEFWEFANEANAEHSYGAEISYGLGSTADQNGKSKQSNYYRGIYLEFDKGDF